MSAVSEGIAALIAEAMKAHAERLSQMIEMLEVCQKCRVNPIQVIAFDVAVVGNIFDDPSLRITEVVQFLCVDCAG